MVDASPWQLADSALQTYTAPNETHSGTWSLQTWRVASAVDTLRFKFVPNKVYYGHAGHKFWRNGADSTKPPTQSGYTGTISFQFDGATATYLGLSAVVTALAFF